MLDGSTYLECACDSTDHVMRFTLDAEDEMIFVEVQLSPYHTWYRRVWFAIKYIFGYQCEYGHWECNILRRNQVKQLRGILDEFDRLCQKSEDLTSEEIHRV